MKKAIACILAGILLAQAGVTAGFVIQRSVAFECYKEGVPQPFWGMCTTLKAPTKMRIAAILTSNVVADAYDYLFPFDTSAE